MHSALSKQRIHTPRLLFGTSSRIIHNSKNNFSCRPESEMILLKPHNWRTDSAVYDDLGRWNPLATRFTALCNYYRVQETRYSDNRMPTVTQPIHATIHRFILRDRELAGWSRTTEWQTLVNIYTVFISDRLCYDRK